MAIAEHGSFTRAAEVLHVSQPTLSQQIKLLEDSLESPLLDRSGRTVRLTPAGEIYLGYVQRALNEIERGTRAINDVQDLSRGSLRLGWNPITDFLACSLLADFNFLYPGITVSTIEMPQDEIEVAVANDQIDVGIAFGKPWPTSERAGDIENHLLFKEPLSVAVGREHLLSERLTPISPEEFAEEPLVLLNTSFALRSYIDNYCMDNYIVTNVAIETNSLTANIELIRSGSLATVLPVSLINSYEDVVSVPLSPPFSSKAITAFCRKDGHQSPACVAFKELLSEWSERKGKTVPI